MKGYRSLTRIEGRRARGSAIRCHARVDLDTLLLLMLLLRWRRRAERHRPLQLTKPAVRRAIVRMVPVLRRRRDGALDRLIRLAGVEATRRRPRARGIERRHRVHTLHRRIGRVQPHAL